MLRAVATDLWTFDRDRKLFGMDIRARMTVLRLGGGRVYLHSPVRFGPELAEELRALGPVVALIAPNKMHYLFLEEAKARFPDAKVLAAKGLKKKRPHLPIDVELGGPQTQLPEELDWHLVGGMPGLNEIVLLHRPSRTLIATDLFFNFVTTESFLLRLYLKASKGYGRPAQTKLLRSGVLDRAAFAESRDLILRWDFDRVIVAHGEIIETGGKAAFAEALAWA